MLYIRTIPRARRIDQKALKAERGASSAFSSQFTFGYDEKFHLNEPCSLLVQVLEKFEWMGKIGEGGESMKRLQSMHDQDPRTRLEGVLRSAREVCAVTAHPIECTSAGDFIGEGLFSRLELGLQQGVNQPSAPDFMYTLYLPSVEEGHVWWEVAVYRLMQRHRLTQQQAEERLIAAEQQERLRLFKVAPPVCAVPVLVINPRTEDIEGFNIYRSSKRGPSLNVAHADDVSMEYWRRSVFIPLEIGHISRESIRCPF